MLTGYGWLSGHYTYGRVIGLLLLPPQCALAVELAAAPPWTRLRTALGSPQMVCTVVKRGYRLAMEPA